MWRWSRATPSASNEDTGPGPVATVTLVPGDVPVPSSGSSSSTDSPPKKCYGLDFDEMHNSVEERRRAEAADGKCGEADVSDTTLLRMAVALVIAGATASVALALKKAIDFFGELKLHEVEHIAEKTTKTLGPWPAFGTLAAINIAYVIVATLCVVVVEPRAKGSGIPEVKAYLNGRRVPNVLSLRTLAGKAIGIVFAVAGNLVVGKEGPMILSGAALANLLPQFLARFIEPLLGLNKASTERDFISVGAACGVSAAFAAPIGGVLIVLEEAATVQHWHSSLTSLVFFGAIAAVVIVAFESSASKGVALANWEPPVAFGAFEGRSASEFYRSDEPHWKPAHVPIFALVGAVGGLLGALFVSLNLKLTRLRQRCVTTASAKVLEVLAVSLVTSAVLYWLPYLAGSCTPKDDLPFDPAAVETLRLFCGPGEVSTLGSLTLPELDRTVKALLHAAGRFPEGELAILAAVFWGLACLTYGVSTPSGLFVPSIVIGSTLGRLLGQGLQLVPGLEDTGAGAMAFVGAAAYLTGATRLTVSAVVVLVETASNVTYAIPIAIAVLVAKVVGDKFTEGLYHEHIVLAGVAFLPDEAPEAARGLRAADVASSPVVCLHEVPTVRALYETLLHTEHSGYPVTFGEEDGSGKRSGQKFSGLVLRQQLLILLKERAFAIKTPRLAEDEEAALSPSGRRRGVRDPDHVGVDAELPAGMSAMMGTDADAIARWRWGSGPLLIPAAAVLRRRTVGQGTDSSSQSTESDPSGTAPGRPVGETPTTTDAGDGSTRKQSKRQTIASRAKKWALRPGGTDAWGRTITGAVANAGVLDWKVFARYFGRELTLKDVGALSHDDLEKTLDLTPYMNVGATTCHHATSATRVHELFRNLGLRHLTVVDSHNCVRGIITRRDVTALFHE